MSTGATAGEQLRAALPAFTRPMKNLMNNVDNVLTESLDGFAAAHADIVALGAEHEYVRRKRNKPGKVALISGGGAGHEPLHAGFVGYGMLDAACPGQIFTSPTPNQMMNAAQAVDGGAGVAIEAGKGEVASLVSAEGLNAGGDGVRAFR